MYEPNRSEQSFYDELYRPYSKLYFEFGQPASNDFGGVLPTLIRVAERVRERGKT
jgi:hypothetical protein